MKSKKLPWYQRIFDAIVPATRAKIQHSEKHVLRALEQQNRELQNELAGTLSALQKQIADGNAKMLALSEQIKKVCDETLWAETFKSSIASKNTWLKDQEFNPGRWAIGYQFLYVMYRVLNESSPKNILELGLGQSTRMIMQYAANDGNVAHNVVEHDPAWIEFFSKNNSLPANTEIVNLELTKSTYKDDAEVVSYKDFAGTFAGKKFDFICIDGPFGGFAKIYARVDVLSILPDCLNDSFVIMLDDVERKGEQATIREIKAKLTAAGIKFREATYSGAKKCWICVSEDKAFLKSV